MECPKCGENLRDWVDYCDACGCDLKEYNARGIAETRVYSGDDDGFIEYRPMAPVANQRLKKKKDKKGAIISWMLVLSMLLVFFLVGAYVYRNVHKTPYEKKIGDLLDIVNGEVTTVEDFMKALFPEVIREDYYNILSAQWELEGKDYDEAMKDANITFSDRLENLVDQKDYEFSYKVITERKLGEAELTDMEAAYTTASQIINVLSASGEQYKAESKIPVYEAYMKLIEDLTTLEFSQGYELEVEFIVENKSSGEKDTETTDIYVVKVDGEWMIDFVHDIDKISGYFGILN